jgi:peptidoglycan/xylan/chitin deacetylase (PgdA/CDA1 family)
VRVRNRGWAFGGHQTWRGRAAAALAGALLAAAVLGAGTAIGDTGASGSSGTSGSSGSTGQTGQTGTTEPPAKRFYYRAIGCKVHGPDVAYTHGPDRKVIAFAFDDGPSIYTSSFVHMLAKLKVPATFFMIGDQVTPAYRATLRLELHDGDALGDHTWTHPFLTEVGDVSSQLSQTIDVIHSMTGYTPCVFRPPYGAYNDSIVATARSLGLATVLWDVDPSDYTLPGVGAIEDRVLEQVQPGSIVISHDGGGNRAQTLAAYPAIIAALRARGYKFETVPQLLGFHTIYVPCRTTCEKEAVKKPLPGAIIRRD